MTASDTWGGTQPAAFSQSIRTLVVSDLVDSTRIMEQLGDRRAMELLAQHDRLARELMLRFGGREIDKSDGFLMLFERPIGAVLWALEYHAALDELSRQAGLEVRARVGIHLGEVFLCENPPEDVRRGAKPLEVEGLAKPVAARVMSLARPGQTLMTRGVFDLARRAAADDEQKLRWLSHGSYGFQGLNEAVEICEVGVDGKSPLRAPYSQVKTGWQRAFGLPKGSPSSSAARRLVPAVLVLVAVLSSSIWIFASREDRWLSVAVAKPVVDPEGDAEALLAFTIRNAMVDSLVSFRGASPKMVDEVDGITGGPTELARAVGADEILTTSSVCQDRDCLVAISRVRGQDGQVIASQEIQIPRDTLLTAANAVRVALRQIYPEHRPRYDARGLEVHPEDYARYVEIRRSLSGIDSIDLEAQIDELAAIRQRAPRFVSAYLLEAYLARMLLEQTQDPRWQKQALELLEQAEALAPEDPEVLYQRFYLELQAGEIEAAAATLDEAEALAPGDVRILDMRCLLFEREGQLEQALELCRRAIERQPSWRRYFNQARIAQEQGQITLARTSLETALRLAPSEPRALSQLAYLELFSGDPRRAAALYTDLVARAPNFVRYGNLGLAHLVLRDYAQSAAAFEKAAESEQPVALLNLADIRWLQGRLDEARELYRAVLERIGDAPQEPAELTRRAQAQARLGDASGAVATVQEALRSSPQSADVAFEAAVVYAAVGDRTAAMVNLQRAVELGHNPSWLGLPWFDDLRDLPDFAKLAATREPHPF